MMLLRECPLLLGSWSVRLNQKEGLELNRYQLGTLHYWINKCGIYLATLIIFGFDGSTMYILRNPTGGIIKPPRLQAGHGNKLSK